MSKRVAILVGGGDVPGLNVCLKSLVYRLVDEGFEPIGVRKGWEGLIEYDLHDPSTYGGNFIDLHKALVRPIDRTPGSFLHASRIDPRRVPLRRVPPFLRPEPEGTKGEGTPRDLTDHLVNVIERLQLHALVTIGNDDLLFYAAHLSAKGVPIVAIPATIHNNVRGTDYTLGFSTGLAKGVEYIHRLRAVAGSREQVLIVETHGGGSGLSSLIISFLAGADRAVIPEVPYDPGKLAALLQHDKRANPGNYAVATVSDGSEPVPTTAAPAAPLPPALAHHGVRHPQRPPAPPEPARVGHGDPAAGAALRQTGSGVVAARLLEPHLEEEILVQSLLYLLRTGPPDGQDLLGASNFAILAARLVRDGRFGRMTAYQRRYNLTDVPLASVARGIDTVDVERLYDVDDYKPKVDLIWAAVET